MNNSKIINLFEKGKIEEAFTLLYRLYPKIENLIISKGGSKTDAYDVFQEALIVFYKNLEKNNFQLTCTCYTYIYAVCKNIWSNELKTIKRQNTIHIQELETEVSLEEEVYLEAENAFNKLNKRCKEILVLFYLKKKKFKEIAVDMNFDSEKTAKNQKYKCLIKAKEHYTHPISQI